MASGAGQARMLALQLEQLTREASGFQAKLASLSSENTRLKLELKQHRGEAQAERQTFKKLENELKAARQELRSMRDQRDADARRSADQKIQTEAQLAQLSQALKEARKQRESQDRRIASDENTKGRRDQRLKGTSALARDQGLELDRLRVTLATRSSELADEETRRRRAEGELAAARTQLAAAEHKMAGMAKEMSLAKVQLQKQKNESESRLKTIQQLQHEHPGHAGGAYGDLILKAQSSIRSMQTQPSGAAVSSVGSRRGSADSSSRTDSLPTRRRPATAGPRTPSAPSTAAPQTNGSSPTSAAAMCLVNDLSGLLAGLDVSASKRAPQRASNADCRVAVAGAAVGSHSAVDKGCSASQMLVIPTKAECDALFARFDINGVFGKAGHFLRHASQHLNMSVYWLQIMAGYRSLRLTRLCESFIPNSTTSPRSSAPTKLPTAQAMALLLARSSGRCCKACDILTRHGQDSRR